MMTTAEPRIAPGSRRDVGLLGMSIARGAGLVARTNPPNLFLTLGRQPKLFRGWLRFAARLMPGGSLLRRETEMVILRVAHVRGCAYELAQHEYLARRAGITADVLAHIVAGPSSDSWNERERTMLTAVDALLEHRNLSDPEWAAFRAQLSEAEAVEFCLLVSHYDMLATVIATLRIQPDERRSVFGRSV